MLSRMGPLCTEPQDSSWQGPEGGESKEVPLKGADPQDLSRCASASGLLSPREVGSPPFINENAESQEAPEGHSQAQRGSDPVFDGS